MEHSIKDDSVQVEQGRQEGLDKVEPINEGQAQDTQDEAELGGDDTVSQNDYQLTRDWERGYIKPLLRYGFADVIAAALYSEGGLINYEPETYKNSMGCKDSSRWKLAIEEEMQSLRKKNTWELVSKLEN